MYLNVILVYCTLFGLSCTIKCLTHDLMTVKILSFPSPKFYRMNKNKILVLTDNIFAIFKDLEIEYKKCHRKRGESCFVCPCTHSFCQMFIKCFK